MKETKFKQTEVGMIPSDWEVKTLGDIFDFSAGGDLQKECFSEYPFGTIKWPIFSNSLENKGLYGYTSNPRYRANCVTITGRGSLGHAEYRREAFDAIVRLLVLSPKQHVDCYFVSETINFRVPFVFESTGVPQLTAPQAAKSKIPLPPTIKEQQRIANALSDVDTLIANLEKLIAKKKNIKQGAMQQLLTGKKRLPGFGLDERTGSRPTDERRKECHSERSAKREVEESSGYKMTELGLIPSDWENVNISKTCTIKARIGWQGLKSTEYLNSGDYILVTGTDFKNGFIDWSTCSYVSEWRFKQDKNIQIKKGDVLVTKDGTIGKVAFLNEIPMEGTLNSGVFVVRSKDLKKIDSVYLSLVFKSSWFDNFLDEITSGSTIVHLYQKDFVKFNFPIPSSIEEQTAIANVLSDMDTEISALETKLAKYRTLKTGMMQQLLTGKIRLV